jgi:putative ABC transport system permease protein
MSRLLSSLRVGWMLGIRQLQNSSRWVTGLIVVIMMLTFLSNVVISGILVGLVEGGNRANREQFTGDVFLSELPDESVIENTPSLIATLQRLPFVENFSARYRTSASVEANFQTRRNFNDLPNSVNASIVGIDPESEEILTGLSELVIEGEYLDSDESGYILIGSTLLDRYSAFSDLFEPLRDVYPNDKLRLTITSVNLDGNLDQDALNQAGENVSRKDDFIVKGIVDSKVDEISTRLFVTEKDFRRLTGRTNLFANEIAIDVIPGVSDSEAKSVLVANEFDRYAEVETAQEAIPKFLDDIQTTFGTLGFLIGIIISGVGAITIFIVIYINAIVRRKQIGILKGIGVRRNAIIFSYITQAVVYAIVGVGLALLLVYFVIVPGVEQNPIDFPFSDGIVVADASLVVGRLIIVLVISLLSGLIPAWLIVRKNTLDSILGR